MKKEIFFVKALLSSILLNAQEMHFGFKQEHTLNCINEADRQTTIMRLEESKATLRQQGILPSASNSRSFPSFSWPIAVNPAFPQYQSCFSTGPHFDHNPASGSLQDYNCGARTYDGHKGTDIGLWPFSWHQVEQNIAHVVAAASGTIIGKDDGAYSYNCAWSSSNWNAVYIQHSDGTVAWYGHLKAGTLTSKQVGESVSVGEFLGVAASSGISTGPHLHFEVLTADNISVDPFDANCNSSLNSSLWANQKNYFDPAVNAVFTHGAPPVFMDCGDPDLTHFKSTFVPGERVYAATYLREIRETDAITFKILRPNGTTFFTTPATVGSFFQNAYFYWYFDGTITDIGTWTVQTILNNAAPVSTTFTVSQSAYPAISVLGSALQGTEWENDYHLSTGDGINYYGYNVYMQQGECKFRQNTNWTTNWGANQFPAGTGINDGVNIPVDEFAYYNITFNRLTGAYSFSPGSYQRSIGILGSALSGWDVDEDMSTSDGILYTINGLSMTNGEAKFRMNDNWLCNWGGGTFPQGTGTNNNVNIPVEGGVYDVSLNRYTGEYAFTPSVITQSDIIDNGKITLYPNPANEVVYLKIEMQEKAEIQIFDLQGKLMIRSVEDSQNSPLGISLKALNKGVYMVSVNTPSNSFVRRLVKLN